MWFNTSTCRARTTRQRLEDGWRSCHRTEQNIEHTSAEFTAFILLRENLKIKKIPALKDYVLWFTKLSTICKKCTKTNGNLNPINRINQLQHSMHKLSSPGRISNTCWHERQEIRIWTTIHYRLQSVHHFFHILYFQ